MKRLNELMIKLETVEMILRRQTSDNLIKYWKKKKEEIEEELENL